MKHLFAKLCVVVCLLLSATTSYAQTAEEKMKILLAKADKDYAKGRYQSSIDNATAIIALLEECGNTKSEYYVTASLILAESYRYLANKTQAIKWNKKALNIATEIFGGNHMDVVLSLNNLARCYCEIGNSVGAIRLLLNCKMILGKERPNMIYFWQFLARHWFRDFDNYTKAVKCYEQALDISRKRYGNKHYYTPSILSDLGNCYYGLKTYSKAIKYYQSSANLYKLGVGDDYFRAGYLIGKIADCYVAMCDYAKALNVYQEELNFYIGLSNKNKKYRQLDYNIAATLNRIGKCYHTLGDYFKAIDNYEQALEILIHIYQTKEHVHVAVMLYNLADCYQELGDYAKAIDYSQQVLTILNVCSYIRENELALCLSDFGLLYSDIGDYVKASRFIKQSLNMYGNKLGKTDITYASLLINSGNLYYQLGDYDECFNLLQQGIDIYKKAYPENHPQIATVLSCLGVYYSAIGSYAKAIGLNRQALAIRKQVLGKNHPDYALLLSNLARCYYKQVDYTKAIELNRQALSIRKKTIGDDHPDYAQSLYNIGVCYHKLGNTKELLPIWNKHFDIDKRYILSQFRSMTEYQRKTLWSKTSMQIIKANHTYAPLGKSSPDACKTSYNSLLFAKGLILSSSIEFDRVINESGNKELLKTFEELRTTQAILNTLYNKPISERPAGETERLESRANELEKVLIAGSKEYADFTRYLSVEWEDVRNALADKDVAIEFIAGTQLLDNTTKPYYAALVLRKGWDSPKYVELMTEEELTEHYKRGAHIYSGYGALELYNRIWAKLEPYLSEGDNVYFAPDGLLHQMNVELFYDVNRKRANEKYNLYRVSSTREVCLDRATIKKSSAVLYGGLQYNMSNDSLIMESKRYRGTPTMVRFSADSLQRAGWEPLPGTKREVDSIDVVCKAHNVKSDIYTATVGNEESFKALSGKKTPIIHIATHGFFFKNEEREKNNRFFERMSIDQQGPRKPDNSMKRSGLIFAGGQRAWLGESIPEGIEDGILLAEEISTMDLSGTDIVVLSACQTGLGEITSDGVFGLQRAFKKAGVKTIIMSLWSVEDAATSLFMRTFYREWLGGKSKRDAFATAQAVTRAYNNDASSWAAFVMLDDYQK